jgi:ligand-binding sensor domain-containing protein
MAIAVTAVVAADERDGFPPVYEHWETVGTADGLPNDHIFWVEVDQVRSDRVWLGTDNGLACYDFDDRSVEVWQPKDGLGHQAVMSVEVDPATGDVWAATFGGLSWLSGGAVVKNFTQFDSGLANDVVYSVVIWNGEVWAATTAGTSRFDPRTGSWAIYTSLNMPTDENWCYNLTAGDGKVFIAAWGGGIIEYDVASDHFRHYIDPDNEFEIELFPNDGLVHNITTSPSYHDGLLWATTYFGLSVYDFRRWRSYFDHDSGLASNFINLGRAQPGTHNGWICTDKGLSVLNHDSNRWVTYKPDPEHHHGGLIELWDGGNKVETRSCETGIAHRFVLSVDFAGDEVWVGTSHGLSHGMLAPVAPPQEGTGS